METARLALRKGALTAISGIVPGGEGVESKYVIEHKLSGIGAVAAMWGSMPNTCQPQQSPHGLVNRNDQLSLAEFEYMEVRSSPMGIAYLSLSVRGQEEKQISQWHCQYCSNYKDSYGMHQCLSAFLNSYLLGWRSRRSRSKRANIFLYLCFYFYFFVFHIIITVFLIKQQKCTVSAANESKQIKSYTIQNFSCFKMGKMCLCRYGRPGVH